MIVYRILKEPYWDNPLSAFGAERTGGRWNPKGIGIIYTAGSPELCLLETLVHLPQVAYIDLPHLRLFRLEIPDEPIRYVHPARLPVDWASPTLIPLLQHYLGNWLTTPDVLTVAVPSAIMPISYNYLLNPQHAELDKVKVINQFDLPLDTRLWRKNG